MRNSISIGVCVCSIALFFGCSDAATGSNAQGQTYCELTCGCVATVGPAPAGAIETCVAMCSQTVFAEYDSCPAEVATWGECLYGSGTCSGCAAEFDALEACASGGNGTGGGGGNGVPTGRALGPVTSVCFHAAVLADGQVIGWGSNGRGQLGADPEDSPDGLARVPLDGRAKAVGCAEYVPNTYIIMEDGTVWSMGKNHNGQLGNGSVDGSREGDRGLARVEGVEGAIQVDVLYTLSDIGVCVVTSAGELKCWGSPSNHGFGPGSEDQDYARPFTVEVPGPVAEVRLVGGQGPCVRLREGGVYCSESPVWRGSDREFVLVPGTEDAVALSRGIRNSCAILQGGTVFCWGDRNNSGDLGGGTSDRRVKSTMVEGLTDAVAVFSGDAATDPCAVRTDGSLWCWGLGGEGPLTEVPLPDDLKPPASRIVEILSGPRWPGFVLADGTLVLDAGSPSCSAYSELECDPGDIVTLVAPWGSLLGFRSDVDPGCVLGGTCDSLRK